MLDLAFQEAVEHHRSGRLKQAEQAYRALLAKQPENVDALHGLGVIAMQVGQPAEAVRLISHAVSQRPESMAFYSNLGMAHQALKQYPEAEAAFRRAIQLDPEVGGLFFNLANCFKEQARLTEAVHTYKQAIDRQPSHASAYMNLGNCYRELGMLEQARQSLLTSIQINPSAAEAYMNLANVLSSLGQPREAEACCRHALALQPTLGHAYTNLGNALRSQGRKPEAAEAYQRAIELLPNSAESHENLGIIHLDLKQLDQAIHCFRRSVEIAPHRPEAWSQLGSALIIRREFSEGDACYRKSIELDPLEPTTFSSWLCWQLYRPENRLETIAARHAEWATLFSTAITAQTLSASSNLQAQAKNAGQTASIAKDSMQRRAAIVDRPMRVGFVSADFGHHPIGFFTIRTLEALRTMGFELVLYSTLNPGGNEITERFRACASLWRDVKHLRLASLIDQIQADQIDILMDLGGHTAGNRLAIFAHQCAPVQATWIASEGTTGLATMNYLIADERLVPRSAEPHYTEQIVRLPGSYVSWNPPTSAPAVSELPALSGQPITFGSFNNPAKYHDGVIELWSQVLNAVPGSRMMLQYKHLSDLVLQSRLLELFQGHGIERSRLTFLDWQPYQEFLGNYGQVDIALDPFPFAGGATTCEALWMGVPVITKPGETYTSRHSLSYLHTLGLQELVASNDEEYVKIAVGLASDLPKLQQLRATLRSRMAASPLCNGAQCAQELATALRLMWAGQVPSSISTTGQEA